MAMATSTCAPGGSQGNPATIDVEAANITVAPVAGSLPSNCA
jgi:hypothetical protein